MTDLETMSLSELKSLNKKVIKAISSFEARERNKALAALEAKAKEMGFSLSELTGASKKLGAKGLRVAGVAKYANPADATQTWTGKGRRPDWARAALAAGKSLDDLAI